MLNYQRVSPFGSLKLKMEPELPLTRRTVWIVHSVQPMKRIRNPMRVKLLQRPCSPLLLIQLHAPTFYEDRMLW